MSLAFNAGNQLETYGNEKLKYDANGNRTADGKYSYTWNEADQLTTITKQGETTPFAKYKYDDDGRRIEKEVNGQITRYFYDGDSINPLYETNGDGNVLRQYVYSIDGVRLAMKAEGQTLFYHYNPRGDVIAMTDQNGQIVANYEYDAWGNVLKSDTKGIAAENPFGYAGYMYDKEIGMYYLIARYYNPEHGVFLSVDPDPGDEDDPVTQNGYTYAGNNPVISVDPDGHAFWLVVNAGFAAYDGYGAYKSGKGARGIAKAAAKGAIGGGRFKYGAKAARQVAKSVKSHKHHAFPKYIGGHSKQPLVKVPVAVHRQLHKEMRSFAQSSSKHSTKYYKNLKQNNPKAYRKILKNTYKFYDTKYPQYKKAFVQGVHYSNKHGYFK
ncbi:tRNA(Glu)-specific nuclease WapA precursor (plasmid) [Bacillus cereus]|nr:tRNA(Glu)-specific nuclease WapA precursor [Bacillus cereus]